MSDTPKTDIMATGNCTPSVDEYEDLIEFTRQLERQLNSALAKLNGDETRGVSPVNPGCQICGALIPFRSGGTHAKCINGHTQ